MDGPRYPAARACAAQLEERFSRRAVDAPGGPSTTPLPDARDIEELIDAAFWGSLLREEGYAPEISLAYLPPEKAERALRLALPLPLDSRALVKLAPAVQRPGIHLGVWRAGEALVVWGTTRVIPAFSFVVEVLGPGLLVVKHRIRDDSVKFENVAVFEGERVKVLSRRPPDRCDPPAALGSFLAPDTASETDSSSVLLRLAVSMRAHGRGGTLLVVPAGTDAWRESIERPIRYLVEPAFSELRDALGSAEEGRPHAHDGLTRVVDALAGLTAVDGATLMTDGHELLAFGVKIGRADGRPRVERVILSEPVEGDEAVVVAPLELGGTRHLSAAQFVQDQRDGVALVASQDGRFTVFAWSPREGMVHAHRVETLLL
jgi:hypothetical protein